MPQKTNKIILLIVLLIVVIISIIAIMLVHKLSNNSSYRGQFLNILGNKDVTINAIGKATNVTRKGCILHVGNNIAFPVIFNSATLFQKVLSYTSGKKTIINYREGTTTDIQENSRIKAILKFTSGHLYAQKVFIIPTY